MTFPTTRLRHLSVLPLALVLFLSACSQPADDTATDTRTDPPTTADPSPDDMTDEMTDEMTGDDMTDEDDDHAEGFWWGTPADPDQATQTIEITADDDFTFNPAAIEVAVGETVTFRVTNVGVLEHDFTLGDAETQDQHGEEMAQMGDMDHGPDEPNAISIDAGETSETTWTFTEPGEILMGCHVVGHYEAGMHGTITITGSA